MGLLSWIKKEKTGEKLVLEALEAFATGDQKTALGDLMQGLIDMAPPKAVIVLSNLQTRMANFALIPVPTPAPAPAATKTAAAAGAPPTQATK
jgi:hypothetical protein